MSADLARKIAKALEVSGTHSPEDIVAALDKGEMQQWVKGETVILTQVVSFPRCKVCEFFMTAGNLDEAWELEGEIEAWAKSQGCTRLYGRGRLGWMKGLKERGYERQWIVASKEI